MRWLGSAACLTALVMTVISCAPSYESKGNSAYKAALKAQGDTRRRLLKEAYIYYNKAIKTHPDKIGKQLRDRYVEMTLTRAEMVLTEGSSAMDALDLYMQDLDKIMSPELGPEMRQMYVDFLITLADSNIANQKIYEGLKLVDKAKGVSASPETVEQKRNSIIDNFGSLNLDIAQAEYERGKSDKDHESLVRAEYYANLALLYDKDNETAKGLLSKVREANRSTYSAYEAVITDKPDSIMHDQVNKYDILLAIPTVTQRGNVTLQTEMYNYSYNPQRLRYSNFFLEDAQGKRYKALKSSKIDKEILDQEHECKMRLVFPSVRGKIKKLVYENGEHYSEKFFF